jgi:hypothetical protein
VDLLPAGDRSDPALGQRGEHVLAIVVGRQPAGRADAIEQHPSCVLVRQQLGVLCLTCCDVVVQSRAHARHVGPQIERQGMSVEHVGECLQPKDLVDHRSSRGSIRLCASEFRHGRVALRAACALLGRAGSVRCGRGGDLRLEVCDRPLESEPTRSQLLSVGAGGDASGQCAVAHERLDSRLKPSVCSFGLAQTLLEPARLLCVFECVVSGGDASVLCVAGLALDGFRSLTLS